MRTSISFASRLSRKLIALINTVFVVIIVLLLAGGYYSAYHLTVKNCDAVLNNGILSMDKFLSSIEYSAKDAEWLISENSSDPEQLCRISDNIVSANSDILSCTIVFDKGLREAHSASVHSCRDKSGNVTSSIVNCDSLDLWHNDWYELPKSTNTAYWTDPENVGDKCVASFSKPLYSGNGIFLGVMRYVVNINGALAQMEENNPYGISYMALVARNDSLFTANADLMANAKARSAIVDMVDGGERGIRHLWKRGLQGIIFFAPVANGWSNVFVFPYAVFWRFLSTFNLFFLVLILLGIVLLYVICVKTVTRMSQPITEFAYAARSIGQGNFKTKIPEVNTKDEFRRFYESLHYMEDSLIGYIGELKKTTAENERFESELNIAKEIQMQMLPHEFPTLDEVDLNATLKPAKEVGGDLYDFFVHGRKLYFIVGDVSGKGVPAALLMAITKASFHTVASLDIPVSEIAEKINLAFCSSNESGMFVTLFLGYIDLDTLKMEYCNCGHNQIIVISQDGKAEYLEALTNIACGCFDEFEFQSESMQLHKGMRLLLYTDGVTEAENKAKELYGDDRLLEFASALSPDAQSSQVVVDLENSIDSFIGSNPQSDDITIMSILLK